MLKSKASKTLSHIYWTATSDGPITEKEAKEAQEKAGYAIPGYGFYNFVCSSSKDLYTATWFCATSCD